MANSDLYENFHQRGIKLEAILKEEPFPSMPDATILFLEVHCPENPELRSTRSLGRGFLRPVACSAVAKRLENCRGLTLVEALVAVGLLGAVVMASVSLIDGVVDANVASQRSTKAYLLAMEKLEDLRSLEPNDPELAQTSTPCPTPANARPNPPDEFDGGVFHRYFCVSDIGVPVKAKQVDMYVEYHTKKRTETVGMSTIIAQIEPWP